MNLKILHGCAAAAAYAVIFIPVLHCAPTEASGKLQLAMNPYASVEWSSTVSHKANFHTHTTRSDGRLSPQEVVDEYHARGYTILAITDHNMATWPWTEFSRFEPSDFSRNRLDEYVEIFEDRIPDQLDMLAVPGNELSDHHHTLSLFSDFETDARDIRQALNEMVRHSDQALAVLAHPFHSWSLKSGSLRIPVRQQLKSMPNGDFTIEFWFRTEDQRRGIIMGNATDDDLGPGEFNIELLGENRIRWSIASEQEQVRVTAHPTDAGIDTRDGEWHHLAAVRADGHLRLYLNGGSVASEPDKLGVFNLNGNFAYIGRDARVDDHYYNTISAFRHPTVYRGDIDHVRFWTRGFQDQDVSNMASGTDTSRDHLVLEYTFEALRDIRHITGGTVNAARIVDTSAGPRKPLDANGTLFSLVPDIAHPLAENNVSTQAIRLGADQPLGWRHIPATATRKYLELFTDYPILIGVEVHGSAGRRSSLDFDLWDFLLSNLMPHRPLWGMANDDMHGLDQLERSWSVFPLREKTMDSVRSAMIAGAYYIVTTDDHLVKPDSARAPVIESILHDNDGGRLIVTATVNGEQLPDSAYLWIADGDVVHQGPVLNFRSTNGINNYARLEIRGPGGTAYTNPFGFATN